MIKKYTYPLSVVIACITLLIVTGLFVAQYIHIKNRDEFKSRQSLRQPLNTKYIQGWMTFEYINRNFNIPDDYLKDILHITNTKYPKITIIKAAASAGINIDDYISTVKNSTEKYLTEHSTLKK